MRTDCFSAPGGQAGPSVPRLSRMIQRCPLRLAGWTFAPLVSASPSWTGSCCGKWVAPARADLSRLRGWVTYMGYAPFAEAMKVVWLLRCSLLPSQSSSIGRGPTGWKVLSLEWNNVLFCRHAVAAAHWATLSLGFQREEGFMSLSVCLCFSPFASWGYWIFSHPGAFSEDGILAYTVTDPRLGSL